MTATNGLSTAALVFIAVCIGLVGATVSRCESAAQARVYQVPPPPGGSCGGPCWRNGVCFAGCVCVKPDPWTYGQCMSIEAETQ